MCICGGPGQGRRALSARLPPGTGRLLLLLFLLFSFQLSDSLVDTRKLIIQILCLGFQHIEFLILAESRSVRILVCRRICRGGRRIRHCLRVAVSRSLPTGQPGSMIPITTSPASTATPSTAEAEAIPSSTHRVRITGCRITGAKSGSSSGHGSHSTGTGSISTWHTTPPFEQGSRMVTRSRFFLPAYPRAYGGAHPAGPYGYGITARLPYAPYAEA